MEYAEAQTRSRFSPPGQTEPVGDPVLVQVYKRLSGLRERLSDAFLRVSASLDRAAGAMPPSVTENVNTSSNGLLDDIGIRLNEIDDLIQALAAQSDRLERIA